jgi:uncharacterized repeat protein (TIGR02543 family)
LPGRVVRRGGEPLPQKLFLPGGKIMPKKAWFFKNKTVWGILGVVLVFAMFATGCPNGTTDDPPPPPTYTVTFDTGTDGSAVPNQTVEEGKTVAKPANPTKAGNTFVNWYKESTFVTVWNFATAVIVQDTTIYAKWIDGDDVQPYKVTFNADGGAPTPAEQSVFPGEPAQEPAKPTKTGFIFDGWYNGTTKWNFTTGKVTAAMTLTAGWIEAVTVTFNTNGGSVIAPVTVAKGNSVYPSDYRPTKSGNVFDGWYTDAALTTPAEGGSITESLTLYAKWTLTSALAGYLGVWRYESGLEAYWLQEDGTAWYFYGSDSYFDFHKSTWSTSQINGNTVTFNEEKNGFTDSWHATFTKNTTTTKTPTPATGGLLGVWVSGDRSIELKSNGDAVLDGYSDTITLKYCVEENALHLLLPQGNLVIYSIGITNGKLNSLSKQVSDPSLAGIWKLTEGGQDYYWTLTANGSGTFHALGASVPFSFTVTEDRRIDGYYDYTVSGNTLTLPDAGWDEETYDFFDIILTKVTSVGTGSGADGDSRLHGTWETTMYGETLTITFNSNGGMTQSYSGDSRAYIWKADGSAVYTYSSSFTSFSRSSPMPYTVSGSTLTIGGDMVLTKK